MNIVRKDRELVRAAALQLIRERDRFDQQTMRLRNRYDRYRPGVLLGGGFVIGLLLGRKQFLQATRSVLSITSLGFGLMKSSLGSMLVAATLRKTPANTRSAVPAVEPPHG